jgi:hypothetical protein
MPIMSAHCLSVYDTSGIIVQSQRSTRPQLGSGGISCLQVAKTLRIRIGASQLTAPQAKYEKNQNLGFRSVVAHLSMMLYGFTAMAPLWVTQVSCDAVMFGLVRFAAQKSCAAGLSRLVQYLMPCTKKAVAL